MTGKGIRVFVPRGMAEEAGEYNEVLCEEQKIGEKKMGEHNLNQVAVELKVVLFTDGRISVHGPLENKLLCLGLLEAAKDPIKNYKVDQNRIVVPEVKVPGLQ